MAIGQQKGTQIEAQPIQVKFVGDVSISLKFYDHSMHMNTKQQIEIRSEPGQNPASY